MSVEMVVKGTPERRYEVTLVSGEKLSVMTGAEQRWFEANKAKYLSETQFTERTDLLDLDRLLLSELMMFRWNQHIARGRDYDGDLVDEAPLRRYLRDQSDAINKLKASMGLSKQARNAIAESGSVPELWADLKRKAKAFGVHRENQLRTALVLMNQLSMIISTYDRSDEHERAKFGFRTETEIIAWIREVMLAEYRAVDEHFRAHTQRLWQRDNL